MSNFSSSSCSVVPQVLKVAVTGASGQIGYASLFRLIGEEIFGSNYLIDLRLLETPQALRALEGIKMELLDCGSMRVGSVRYTDDPEEAFFQADWIILIGSRPRGPGMERKDLLEANAEIFLYQGTAIAKVANPHCKVFVVGNPCNTNAYIVKELTKNKLSSKNIYAMMMLDQLRGSAILAEKANVPVKMVKNLCVWGNHSSTQVPMFEHALIHDRASTTVITDVDWLEKTFTQTVRERGATVIKVRGHSSAGSAANAMIVSVHHIAHPNIPSGRRMSIAMESDGQYGVDKGLIFGFPTVRNGKELTIVDGLELSEWSRGQIKKTLEELLSERDAVTKFIS